MPVIDDKYEIQGKLGTGGQGNVYKAWHRHLNEYYAVKLIADEVADVPELSARFRGEAQTMARFRHENIVRVHDLVIRDGRPYCLVLDLVDGPNLSEHLKSRGPLSLVDALEVARQLASALEHAHGFRVWHRDVKPRNVLIESTQPWRVLLTDFGIAKIESADERTRSGHVVGTMRYAAPEQLGYVRERGERPVIDQRTDVFGLGLVLFEMIEGRQFFEAMDLGDVVGWAWDPNPAPIVLTRDAHPCVQQLIARALARDPAERWPSMAAMLHEISRCQREVGRPADQAPVADDSDELSDDRLDAEIRRLERERLRRQAQHARAQLEAARSRATTAGVPPAAPDAVGRADRLEAEGQDALGRSLYDQARERFEAAVAELDRAAERARRPRPVEGVEAATESRRAAELAGARTHAADAMAIGDRLLADAESERVSGRAAEAERRLDEARRAYDGAAVTARVRADGDATDSSMTRGLPMESPPRRARSLGPYLVVGAGVLLAVLVRMSSVTGDHPGVPWPPPTVSPSTVAPPATQTVPSTMAAVVTTTTETAAPSTSTPEPSTTMPVPSTTVPTPTTLPERPTTYSGEPGGKRTRAADPRPPRPHRPEHASPTPPVAPSPPVQPPSRPGWGVDK